jgi:anti-anti-sigma factor
VIELISEKNDLAAIVRIIGRVDVETSKQLEDACKAWIDQGETLLILDFTQVRYISSWGLRCVLTVAKKLDAKKGRLIICGLNAMVKEVFQVSGFDSVFRTFPTLQDVLASL